MKLDNLRSNFIAEMLGLGNFLTVGLLKQVSLSVDEKCPALGMIKITESGRIFITLQPAMGQDVFNTALLHQLRHIPQIASFTGKYSKMVDIAMDVALNQDVAKLLGKQSDEMMSVSCTLLWLRNILGKPDIPADMDYIYYLGLLHESDSAEGDGIDEKPGDFHDFANATSAQTELADIMGKAVNDAMQLQAQTGLAAVDMPLHFLRNQRLNKKTSRLISKLKALTISLSDDEIDMPYKFGTCERVDEDLPGQTIEPGEIRQITVLLDTSGSMCESVTLGQLAAALNQLQSRGKVREAYCFDTKLYPILPDTEIVMRGGGGTVITEEMHQELREGLGTKQTLQVLVLTDDEITWQTTPSKYTKWRTVCV